MKDWVSSYLKMVLLEEKLILPFFYIKTRGKYLLLVQIYVDDIIFGATNESLCQEFSKFM